MLSEWSGRELLLAAGPQAPALARRAVTDRFAGRLETSTLDDVQLVVSELVTNSCVHADVPAGRSIRLLATVDDDAVHLEVRDSGLDGAVALRTPDGNGGFGLHIIQALATRWGIDHTDGTVVWCELPAGA